MIRARDNANEAIVDSTQGTSKRSYFALLRLQPGETWRQADPVHERIYAVLTGQAGLHVDELAFSGVGVRPDIWGGPADSVYAPVRSQVEITAGDQGCEIAIGGGRCDTAFEPFRIPPEEVDAVEVGSSGTKSHRRICHILGQNGQGRAGNLLVSELYCEEGCWNGYPPHKHDQSRDGETNHEEVYHYRFNPDTGFGGQFIYSDGEEPTAELTRHGDTIVIEKGYHPTVTSPGHEAYIFTVLVGAEQRSLIQHFETRHTHLMAGIPGLDAMREKFRSE
jgi:5-deoxy-glucuronate isomerase